VADLYHARVWAADNNRFNPSYDDREFIRMLCDFQTWRQSCLFVLAPDVVGDAAATLAEFPRWYPVVAGYGYPVALAAQDGMVPDNVPWNKISALFVGGSTRWKMSPDADALIYAAKKRGKWVHIGRVNSYLRANHFRLVGVDSIDGTHEIYAPDKHIPMWNRWLTQLNQQRPLPMMGDFLCC